MSAEFDVVVVGAGPIGLATALLSVNRAGLAPARVAVVDRKIPDALDHAHPPPIDLRVFALSRASERVLRAVGAWDDVAATRAQAFERMHVWHADVPPRSEDALIFDAAEIGERDLGVIVENAILQAALAGAARRAGVALIAGEVTALSHERNAVVVSAADRAWRAKLVVGADGAHSRVRELAGLDVRRTDYGQTAIVAMVATGKPHENTAWQRFLGHGTLAFLPLPDGRSSIVWSLPTAKAEELLVAPATVFERELTEDSDEALGAVRLESDRLRFPLWKLAAERYAGARVALIGDAAHVVHPLAGQGANLGFLDAAALADVLAEAAAEREDPGAERILRRFERWRGGENRIMASAIDAFDRWLAHDGGGVAKLARRGMPLVGRSSMAKRLFIERAMGHAGELPRAARELR